MHNDDMDEGLGAGASIRYDVNTTVYSAADNTVYMNTDVNVDAVHVYTHGCDL